MNRWDNFIEDWRYSLVFWVTMIMIEIENVFAACVRLELVANKLLVDCYGLFRNENMLFENQNKQILST